MGIARYFFLVEIYEIAAFQQIALFGPHDCERALDWLCSLLLTVMLYNFTKH